MVSKKSLGFCTFDRWWNEDYDQFEGAVRVQMIKSIILDIMSWSQEKITDMLVEMGDTLEHNRNLFLTGIFDEQK